MVVIAGFALIVAGLFLIALGLMNYPPLMPFLALTTTAIVVAIASQDAPLGFFIWITGITAYCGAYFWGLAFR